SLYINKTKNLLLSGIIAISANDIASCGLSCYQRGEVKSARDFFIIAKNEFSKLNDSIEIGRMQSNIAVTLELEGKYDLAVENYHQALDIFIKMRDKNSESMVYNNLGVVFQEMQEKEKALKYHKLAFKSKQSLMDTIGVASSYNNLGVQYEENTNQLDSALYYYQKSLDIYRLFDMDSYEAQLLSNIASIYIQTNKIPEAIEILQDAAQQAEQIDNKLLKVRIYKNAALAHLKTNNLTEAEYYTKKGLAISKSQNDINQQVKLLSIKAELHEKKHEYTNCIATLREKEQLKDSLQNTKLNEAISKQEVLFDTKQKAQQIETAEQALMFSNFQLNRQKNLMILTIFSFLLIALIVLLLVYRSRLKAKNRQITLENKMLRSQMSPHFMFNALSAIHNYILEHESMESMIYLLDFSKLMRNILDASRAEEISIEKEIEILTSYLKLQQLRFSNKFEYKIIIDDKIDIENTNIPPMLLQPFIENAIEHGMRKLPETKKGLIQLSIKKTADILKLQVSNNGPGFSTKQNSEKPKYISHAINITKERIRAINHDKTFKIQQQITKNSEQGIIINFEIKIL
ncbi:MAG: tetratricopeptide repeat protein, partial [Bacteroidota bacterium]|nr:tetratricopeptide repeat protein [Bacteroidota bacterium]